MLVQRCDPIELGRRGGLTTNRKRTHNLEEGRDVLKENLLPDSGSGSLRKVKKDEGGA